MRAEQFVDALGCDFFSGVPDSLLKPFCDCLEDRYGPSAANHIVAANEGNAVALAAGYHLSTGKLPVVYMQNSGIGNAVNPIASLLHSDVYGIPCIFIVGWRGEPGIHDEPQHVFQGKITEKLLNDLDIKTYIVNSETTSGQVLDTVLDNARFFEGGGSIAFLIKKGSLEYSRTEIAACGFTLCRETAVEMVVGAAGNDTVFSTTGKISRELFEIREKRGECHCHDFLSVGSMGHCSSMALSAALCKPHRRVWCIDGDGAAIMHLGAMAIIGARKPENLIHVVLNNAAHDTVGGMPTVGDRIDFCAVACACGYGSVFSSNDEGGLDDALKNAKASTGPAFIEVRVKRGCRNDLGRPANSARYNKEIFMKHIHKDSCISE